ncbi:hypothetical protein AMJ44_03900 [candidate division WOR-1 bacterium DG_54_3]|uniref:Epoxyqueuosine reductase QueH n=1 Tax=candidate division WOR-1 bacterium DG_54_3 TaxID=1703775 RepID=A0A0S7Y3P3_UNCSA|nr:MAG: hypothetical protein AMJ44_03900 [candidate division WOR-1 bacterium DG_54_3]
MKKRSKKKKTSKAPKVLLHTCCAPCTTAVYQDLKKTGFDVTGFFYNPNIHPYTEYEKRLLTMKLYAALANLKMVYVDLYDIENFFDIIFKKKDKRCLYCYILRLHKTAAYAKKHGFDCFTTTLLVSPSQKHAYIKQAARIVAKKYGVEFLYKDFRKRFSEGRHMAKHMNLYRQRYCGCIYSERDRFRPACRRGQVKHL